MIGNLLAWFILILVTVFFGWLCIRAWRSKNALLKWGGVVLAGLLTLLLALVSVVSAMGLYQFYAPRGQPVEAIQVQGTPDQIARGQHLADSLCAGCHTTTGQLPLTGGRDIGLDSPLPIGHFYSINLTPGGPIKDWSDGEIMRVLREGVDRDGHPLVVMSGNGVRYLSDTDKQAIIAYLRSQPSAANPVPDPPDQPDLLLAAMVGAGIVELRAPLVGPVSAPPKAVTVEYGAYVAKYQDCAFCHGKDLTGGTDPIAPPGPNLRVVQGWTQDQFVTTLRAGKDPDGHVLSDVMPWKFLNRMDDQELSALYLYLKSLPPARP